MLTRPVSFYLLGVFRSPKAWSWIYLQEAAAGSPGWRCGGSRSEKSRVLSRLSAVGVCFVWNMEYSRLRNLLYHVRQCSGSANHHRAGGTAASFTPITAQRLGEWRNATCDWQVSERIVGDFPVGFVYVTRRWDNKFRHVMTSWWKSVILKLRWQTSIKHDSCLTSFCMKWFSQDSKTLRKM